MAKDIKDLLNQWSTFRQPKVEDHLSPDQYYNTAHNVIVDKNDPYDEADFSPAEDSQEVDGGFEDSDESKRQQSIAYSASKVPVGPDGGFRADQVRTTQPTGISKPDQLQAKSPETPYDRYIGILKQLQGTESSQVRDINNIRGGNQIAQAIASGFGGKIGDGSEQLNKLQESVEKPIKDQLQLMKVIKDQQGGNKSPVGFGQFTNLAGDPLVYDPMTKTVMNTAHNRPHRQEEGIIRAAVDRFAVDPRSGEGFVFKPGVTQAPNANNPASSQAFGGAMNTEPIPTAPQVAPMQPQSSGASMEIKTNPAMAKASDGSADTTMVKQKQVPYDIKQSLNNHDRTILEKDIDAFQKAVEEPKRIISEIGAISDSTIELARTNPNAAETLGAQIARIMQGSRLTDADVKLYVGRMGITNWLPDWVGEIMTGNISKMKAADIKQTLEVYKGALKDSLKQRAKNYANTVKTNFDPALGIDTDSLSELYYTDMVDSKKSNPQLDQAKSWLSKNANHKQADAVKEKIKRLESQ